MAGRACPFRATSRHWPITRLRFSSRAGGDTATASVRMPRSARDHRPTPEAVQTPPYEFRVPQQNASVHANPGSSGERRLIQFGIFAWLYNMLLGKRQRDPLFRPEGARGTGKLLDLDRGQGPPLPCSGSTVPRMRSTTSPSSCRMWSWLSSRRTTGREPRARHSAQIKLDELQ